MTKFKIDIAIITRNRVPQLKSCLSRIATNKVKPQNVFVIDASDNVSSDDVKQYSSIIKKRKINFKHIKVPHKGLAFSRNEALRSVKSNFFAFIDDDEYMPADWVANVRDIFLSDPTLDVLCGPKIPKHGNNYWNGVWNSISGHEFDYEGIVFSVPAGNSVYKKSFLVKNNIKFDNRLAYSSEDHDFSKKLVKHGAHIYFHKKISVKHDYRTTFEGFVKQWFYYGLGKSTYHLTLLLPKKTTFTNRCIFATKNFFSTFPYRAGKPRLKYVPAMLLLNFIFLCGYIYGFYKKPINK